MGDAGRYKRTQFFEYINREGNQVRRYLPFYLVQIVGVPGYLWESCSPFGRRDFTTGCLGHIPEVHVEDEWNRFTAQMTMCRKRPDEKDLQLHDYSDNKFPYA